MNPMGYTIRKKKHKNKHKSGGCMVIYHGTIRKESSSTNPTSLFSMGTMCKFSSTRALLGVPRRKKGTEPIDEIWNVHLYSLFCLLLLLSLSIWGYPKHREKTAHSPPKKWKNIWISSLNKNREKKNTEFLTPCISWSQTRSQPKQFKSSKFDTFPPKKSKNHSPISSLLRDGLNLVGWNWTPPGPNTRLIPTLWVLDSKRPWRSLSHQVGSDVLGRWANPGSHGG